MSKTIRDLKAITDRVVELEASLKQTVTGVNQAFVATAGTVDSIREALEAVIDVIGKEIIFNKMSELREERIRVNIEETKKSIEKDKEEGKLIPSDKADPGTLVVCKEIRQDGAVVNQGYVPVVYNDLKKETQDIITGHSVGDVIQLPEGGSLEILEIYKFVQKESQ